MSGVLYPFQKSFQEERFITVPQAMRCMVHFESSVAGCDTDDNSCNGAMRYYTNRFGQASHVNIPACIPREYKLLLAHKLSSTFASRMVLGSCSCQAVKVTYPRVVRDELIQVSLCLLHDLSKLLLTPSDDQVHHPLHNILLAQFMGTQWTCEGCNMIFWQQKHAECICSMAVDDTAAACIQRTTCNGKLLLLKHTSPVLAKVQLRISFL